MNLMLGNTSHSMFKQFLTTRGRQSRLAVNSVTYGDYAWPLELSRFVTELNAGFRLLNLKNDNLRKRFDVLKYDVKKIEEVVYDLTIRGLKPELVAQQAGSHQESSGSRPPM